jgi:hypothetical protein
LAGYLGARLRNIAGRREEQRGADNNANGPYETAMEAIAEFNFVFGGLVPARAHAAGHITAGHECSNLLRHGPKDRKRSDHLCRDAGIGPRRSCREANSGAKGQKYE